MLDICFAMESRGTETTLYAPDDERRLLPGNSEKQKPLPWVFGSSSLG